jgi:hypothetical protein
VTLYGVRVVLRAPDRDCDVHAEGHALMVALIDAGQREPAIRDVAVSSASDEGTVTAEVTVIAASGQLAEAHVGAVVCLLTAYPPVATSRREIRPTTPPA